MAFSSVKVQFEIGHEASLRNKRTPEGFTHDWEVFVRGADNTDIQHFVEKVVFHLHETFPKPKRVVKEPPYSVKECGYAGFVLPIDVYLKNKEEPKKIEFTHDLQLQTSGPPITKVNREPRIFQNPSEDFRRNLIRGGGVGVDNPSDGIKSTNKKSTLSPKKLEDNKLTAAKKHKPDLSVNNSFAELFGTPIRRNTPEPKKLIEAPKKDVDRKKANKPVVTKDDKEFKDREKPKDRDKEKPSKEKSKRPPSPPPSSKIKEDIKKEKSDDKDRKRDESSKEKERKEKHREKDPDKSHKKEKRPKEPEVQKKSLVPVVEKPNVPEINIIDAKKEKIEKEKHRHKHKKREKEKTREKEKHKHKEKDDKDGKEKIKKKQDAASFRIDKEIFPSPSKEKPKVGPLNQLFSELSSSASAISDDDDPIPPVRSVPEPTPPPPPKHVPDKFTTSSNASSKSKDKNHADSKLKTQKSEESSSFKEKKEKVPKKRSSKGDSETKAKRIKIDRERSSSSEREREREREIEAENLLKQQEEQERRAREREEEERRQREVREREEELARKEREAAETSALKSKSNKGRKRNREKVTEEIQKPEEPPQRIELTKEYLAQLRELQNRIMTIEDNAELQKVVKVIAESGQYEVTKKTFDFDLCALDQATVRRLQQFFELPT